MTHACSSADHAPAARLPDRPRRKGHRPTAGCNRHPARPKAHAIAARPAIAPAACKTSEDLTAGRPRCIDKISAEKRLPAALGGRRPVPVKDRHPRRTVKAAA